MNLLEISVVVIFLFQVVVFLYDRTKRCFICHVCKDETKKMTRTEYNKNGGKHKHCNWPIKS